MSANQDLEPKVRVWLHERLTERPDPQAILDEVLSRLPTTPQRKHRWWPLGHLVGPDTSTGRFTMSSALKFVAASVVVALFGGFLLAGVLTDRVEDDAPPAAVEASPDASAESDASSLDPAIVDGRTGSGQQLATPILTAGDGVTVSVGAHYQMELTEMDDPRLNGTFQIVWNRATYDGIYNVVTASNRIDNEDGSWVGVERGYRHPTRGWNWQGLYEGQGAYEGLSALLFWEQGPGYDGHGIIFPGEMPEPLEPPAAAAIVEQG